jgi:[ribosomal protein S18]-alanine N-acetyltransferase
MEPQDLDPMLTLAAESPDGPHWTRQDYEQILLADPAAPLARRCLVAMCAGNVAGFAVASWLRQDTVAEVEGLVVEKEHRRQGIGGALVLACRAWAAHAGASKIRLEVRASNAAAIALYGRHGFRPAGSRRGYYSAPPEDALLLEAALFPRTV